MSKFDMKKMVEKKFLSRRLSRIAMFLIESPSHSKTFRNVSYLVLDAKWPEGRCSFFAGCRQTFAGKGGGRHPCRDGRGSMRRRPTSKSNYICRPEKLTFIILYSNSQVFQIHKIMKLKILTELFSCK